MVKRWYDLSTNMHKNVCDVDHFCKVSVLRNGLSHGLLPFTFPNTFSWLPPSIERKGIPLYDNIAWYETPQSPIFLFSQRSNFMCFLKNIPHKKSP